jgi:DNA-binding transcriptional regulator YhcF (GntR family)
MNGEIERRTVATQLADRIEQEIHSATWLGKLPGKRTLAERYAVNVKTCATAISLLEHRGLVGPAVAGMGRVIKARPQMRPESMHEKARCMLIVHTAAGHLSIGDFQLLHRMEDAWKRVYGKTVWAAVDYARYKRPGPVLDAQIRRHAADALLLYVPESGWSREAGARLPFYQIGGPYQEDAPLSLGAYSIETEVRRVVTHLRGLGHRRILLPSDSMGERMRRSVVEALSEGNDSKPEYGRWEDYCAYLPESLPEAWIGYWKKAFASLKPTAVVIFEGAHLLSLYGYCSTHGIRIPLDLSVVSIGYDPLFEWCKPKPLMMRYPSNAAVAHFQQWLDGGLKPIGRKFFPLEMVAGESVARLG